MTSVLLCLPREVNRLQTVTAVATVKAMVWEDLVDPEWVDPEWEDPEWVVPVWAVLVWVELAPAMED